MFLQQNPMDAGLKIVFAMTWNDCTTINRKTTPVQLREDRAEHPTEMFI